MDPLIVVSPHPDDAVLSCGQFLAGYPTATVVTVFAGTPPRGAEVTTTYDANCGFAHAAEAMSMRRGEDSWALAKLDATPRHLDFLDHQYRSRDVLASDIAVALGRVGHEVYEVPDVTQRMLVPLGLSHPDHLLTARACALLLKSPAIEGWVYEELPYRVMQPELVPPALASWERWGFAVEQGFIGTGSLDAKEDAVRCYESQLPHLNMHAVLCPERYWRVTPCD